MIECVVCLFFGYVYCVGLDCVVVVGFVVVYVVVGEVWFGVVDWMDCEGVEIEFGEFVLEFCDYVVGGVFDDLVDWFGYWCVCY